jgi:hypothetical protein
MTLGKLLPRLEGGAGGGCPVLVFGISPRIYVSDVTDEGARELIVMEKAKKKAAKQAANAILKSKGLAVLDADDEEEEE